MRGLWDLGGGQGDGGEPGASGAQQQARSWVIPSLSIKLESMVVLRGLRDKTLIARAEML